MAALADMQLSCTRNIPLVLSHKMIYILYTSAYYIHVKKLHSIVNVDIYRNENQ